MTIEKYVAALGPVLSEARQRPDKGGVGHVQVGDAFQVDNATSPNGKATLVVREVYVTYGLGEPTTWIGYDYKVGPDKKGNEKNTLKRFLEMVGAA